MTIRSTDVVKAFDAADQKAWLTYQNAIAKAKENFETAVKRSFEKLVSETQQIMVVCCSCSEDAWESDCAVLGQHQRDADFVRLKTIHEEATTENLKALTEYKSAVEKAKVTRAARNAQRFEIWNRSDATASETIAQFEAMRDHYASETK